MRALTLLLTCSAAMVAGVVSPLDKVTQDMKAMKDTLDSIQASLITSVSLLQDQLTDFTGKATASIDSRLSSIDSKVTSLESGMADLVLRAHAWDSFQHHIGAWNSQLSSLDQKLELMSRTQSGKLVEQGNRVKLIPDIDFKLAGLTRKMGELGGKVQVIDGRLLSLQDNLQEKTESTMTALDKVAEEVRNSSRSNRSHHKVSSRHGGHGGEPEHHNSCRENRVILEDVQTRTSEILDMVTQVQEDEDGPTFSYLRAPQQVGLYTDEDEEEGVDEEGDFLEAEDKFVALFRRITTPFKRVNKRLRTMEASQDNIESVVTDIKTQVESTSMEMKRDLTDFLLSATEQQQEQTHMLEGQAAALASLSQCCSGVSSDQGRLAAQAGPVLDRLDRWMTSWQNSVGQQFERVLQQNSYDHDSHSKGHKELERLLVEGFDRCQAGLRARTRRPGISPGTSRAVATTTESLPPTEEVLRDSTVKLPLVGTPATELPQPSSCEEASGSGVVRVGGKERYCHQDTTGAGWTVGPGYLLILATMAIWV